MWHWYAGIRKVFTTREIVMGPYPTRKEASRRAAGRFSDPSVAEVRVFYRD